jgi:Spy/CpxP family protein refolding chaperone
MHRLVLSAMLVGLATLNACSPQPATKAPAPAAPVTNSTTSTPAPIRTPKMFKLQVQDDEKDARVWHDVKNAQGKLLTFEKEPDARAKLEELYPVLVKMEQYAGPKRTRVITIITDEDDWPKKK